ncbi:uncharacterized protein LOC117584199 [Drosophila guanche]|uniref:uncharacterized protein LOC117584199 n=1 Tax=Drosophila guanche TaxID=7266 RepID=UPI0014717A3C|nr:uncharacterized protein LOC117584199 [Drosophila guanche]
MDIQNSFNMLRLLCVVLVFGQTLSKEQRLTFAGQCPKFMPLPHEVSKATVFTGSWYLYAVHPNYLQEKCVKRTFQGHRIWRQFAETDDDHFIVQYFCYQDRDRYNKLQHMRSISIFVKEQVPTAKTIASITNALMRHFKFPLRLLNYTDNSFCTEFEYKDAQYRV